MSICNQLGWVSSTLLTLSSVLHLYRHRCLWPCMVRPTAFVVSLVVVHGTAFESLSSSKDQLTGASVAIKKIMKPFSTPVLSKRTYRELKLLKHIQHENVCLLPLFLKLWAHLVSVDYQPKRCLHFSSGGYVSPLIQSSMHIVLNPFCTGTLSQSFLEPISIDY
jgi:serine/threonine protein kinase